MKTEELIAKFSSFESTFLSLVLKDKPRAEDELFKACNFFAKVLSDLPHEKIYYVQYIPVQILQHIVKYATNSSVIIKAWKNIPYRRGDFQWNRCNIDFLINVEFYRAEPILDPWLWVYSSYAKAATDLGNDNLEEVISQFNLKHILGQGSSIFWGFFEDYSFTKATQKTKPLEEYKKFFEVSSENKIYSMHDAKRNKAWESIKNPKQPYTNSNTHKNGRAKMSLVRHAFCQFMEDNLRHAEDLWRQKNQLPLIGEGWKSETELYHRVKKYLPNEEVIMHGKPKWLGRQHFDIWIPKRKVAIEYQGEQHDQPIDFFGGEVAFEQNKRRDARKKSLCIKNGVKLIEVRPGYDINIVLSKI